MTDRVELAPKAVADFDELLAYLVERNPTAAVKLRAAILDDLARLARTSPRLDGPTVTLATGERCRRSFVHPVAIYYRRAPGLLEVVRICCAGATAWLAQRDQPLRARRSSPDPVPPRLPMTPVSRRSEAPRSPERC